MVVAHVIQQSIQLRVLLQFHDGLRPEFCDILSSDESALMLTIRNKLLAINVQKCPVKSFLLSSRHDHMLEHLLDPATEVRDHVLVLTLQ